jgi:hypothetical protein
MTVVGDAVGKVQERYGHGLDGDLQRGKRGVDANKRTRLTRSLISFSDCLRRASLADLPVLKVTRRMRLRVR